MRHEPFKRHSVRLNATTYAKICSLAARYQMTRTAIVEGALRRLVHDIQCDRFREFEALQRTTSNKTCILYVNLPIIITDYLRLNQYRLTSAIVYAVHTYFF